MVEVTLGHQVCQFLQQVPESVKIVGGVGVTLCGVAITAAAIWGFAASCQQKWKLQTEMLAHRQETQRTYEVINAAAVLTGVTANILLLLTSLGTKLAAGTLIATCSGIGLCVVSVIALNYLLSRTMSLPMEPHLKHSGLVF